jgi:hypothetical protein
MGRVMRPVRLMRVEGKCWRVRLNGIAVYETLSKSSAAEVARLMLRAYEAGCAGIEAKRSGGGDLFCWSEKKALIATNDKVERNTKDCFVARLEECK